MKFLKIILMLIILFFLAFLFIGLNISIFCLGSMLFGIEHSWIFVLILYILVALIICSIIYIETHQI